MKNLDRQINKQANLVHILNKVKTDPINERIERALLIALINIKQDIEKEV